MIGGLPLSVRSLLISYKYLKIDECNHAGLPNTAKGPLIIKHKSDKEFR